MVITLNATKIETEIHLSGRPDRLLFRFAPTLRPQPPWFDCGGCISVTNHADCQKKIGAPSLTRDTLTQFLQGMVAHGSSS